MTTAKTGIDWEAKAVELLSKPEFFRELSGEFRADGLVGEERNAHGLYTIATSRVLENPLGGTARAASSAGKNLLATRVLAIFPSSEVVELSSASDRSWNYAADDFCHKVVYLDEHNNSSGPMEPIRILRSRGQLVHRTLEFVDGKRTLVTHVANGPMAFISTSNSRLQIDDETRNFSLWLDDSEAQTRKIVRAYHHRVPQISLTNQKRVWKKVQRILAKRAQDLGNGVGIVFPTWFDEVAERVFVGSLAVRRYYPGFVEFCRVIALIRAFQDGRKKTDERLMVNYADFAIAAILFEGVIFDSLNHLDGSTLHVADCLRRLSREQSEAPVQARDVAAELGIPIGQAYKLLREAVTSGVAKRVNRPEKGNVKLYLPTTQPRFVPEPERLYREINMGERVCFVHPLTGEWIKYTRSKT